MTKVLILTGSYFPKPLANGICVHQVALSLKGMGYEVHVLCFNKTNELEHDVYDGIKIHRVKARLFSRLWSFAEANIDKFKGKFTYKIAMLISKFEGLLFLPIYPIKSPLFIRRYNRYAEKLHKRYCFDCVISSFNPIEACVGGLHLKRKYSDLIWILYVLDSLTNGVDNRYLSRTTIDSIGWKWEKKLYTYSDKVLNIKCHENHHNQKRYDKFKNKMDIVDIPLLKRYVFKKEKLKNPYDRNYINLVYTGALSSRYRDPKYVCEIFIKLNSNNNYKLHFYSRGNTEDMLQEYQELTNGGIIRHGYVEYNKSIEAVYCADILISIGNGNSDMIPSKTFEYIATGKKIIHFYKNKSDSSLPYYRKYPLSLLIDENDDLEENFKKIQSFIKTPYKILEFENIKGQFIENTPEYSAKIVSNIINANKEKHRGDINVQR